MDEFKQLLIAAITLKLEKKFDEQDPLKHSEELQSIVERWELACKHWFGDESEDIVELIRDSMAVAYVYGALESIGPVIEAQIEVLDKMEEKQ